mmetsp:Transcript_18073/g.43461  ORF Transcript_18073/g.43461 Transcript_18073/m.43461 type:complete len:222 (+) Transcript_18073:392-1057(+)
MFCHDSLDTYQGPQRTTSDQIQPLRIQKSTKYQYESTNDIGMYLGTAIPCIMRCNCFKEGAMNYHKFDIHVRRVGSYKCRKIEGLLLCLIIIGNFLRSHGKPLVLAMYPIGARIILVSAREGRPFNQYVFLPVVRTAFFHHSLDECRIIDLRSYSESPFSPSRSEPTKQTGLERMRFTGDAVLEVGFRIYLMVGESFDNWDKSVMRCALNSQNVDNLTIVT